MRPTSSRRLARTRATSACAGASTAVRQTTLDLAASLSFSSGQHDSTAHLLMVPAHEPVALSPFATLQCHEHCECRHDTSYCTCTLTSV
jgi:hypothetical protein